MTLTDNEKSEIRTLLYATTIKNDDGSYVPHPDLDDWGQKTLDDIATWSTEKQEYLLEFWPQRVIGSDWSGIWSSSLDWLNKFRDKAEAKSKLTRILAGEERSQDIVFPKYINIKANNNKYLSEGGPCTAVYNSPEKYCTFYVQPFGGNKFAFRSNSGGWLATEGDDVSTCEMEDANGNRLWGGTKLDSSCLFTATVGQDNCLYFQASNGSFLNLDGSYIFSNKTFADDSCKFTISEAALKREIVDVKYDLAKAVKKNIEPQIFIGETASNPTTSGDAVKASVSYSYTQSLSGTWNNSVGVQVGVETTFSTGVPLIAEGKITVSTNVSYGHEWGGSKGEEKTVSHNLEIDVPPMTSARASFIVKKANVDVPFSYVERITYLDGKTENVTKEGGIYNNLDCYDTQFELTEIKAIDEQGQVIATVTPIEAKVAQISQLRKKLSENKTHVEIIQGKLSGKQPKDDWETDEILNKRLEKLQSEQVQIGADLEQAQDELQDLQAQVEVVPK